MGARSVGQCRRGNRVRSFDWCSTQGQGSARGGDMALLKRVNTESSFEATCQQKGETVYLLLKLVIDLYTLVSSTLTSFSFSPPQ